MGMNEGAGDVAPLEPGQVAVEEAERLASFGAIQPHGCMLACNMQNWVIGSASANCPAYFGEGASALIGLRLDQVLPRTTVHDLRNVLQSAMVSGSAERLVEAAIDHTERRYDLTVHAAGPHAVLEFVPRVPADALGADPVVLVKSMMGRLRRQPSLERLLGFAASQVRAVTGFERVMITKFREDGSGQVIAESLRSGMVPFKGWRYPQSDFPAQERALHKRQWLRIIPDVNYAPVSLVVGPDEEPDLDLSLASLRGVSPVHLAHLRKMGLGATLTISLMDGNELWGLVACHHDAPRRVSASVAAVAELFGQVLSLQIETKERSSQLSDALHARVARDRLLASMQPEETIFDNLARFYPVLEELIPCDGIGVWTGGGFFGAGAVPSAGLIPALIRFLQGQAATQTFATDMLGSFLGDLGEPRISGVLALPFPRVPRDYLLFFRHEVVQTVTWGSNPHDADDVGEPIRPRRSFEPWHEIVRERSLAWRPAEVQVAEALRVSLLDIMLRRADMEFRESKAAQEREAGSTSKSP